MSSVFLLAVPFFFFFLSWPDWSVSERKKTVNQSCIFQLGDVMIEVLVSEYQSRVALNALPHEFGHSRL